MKDENDFKLADCFLPGLEEGRYHISGTQTVTQPEEDSFSAGKDFCVAATPEQMPENIVFRVHPADRQRGDFSGTLPYIVFSDASYPWLRRWTEDTGGFRVPWLALIVVSEEEQPQEIDMKYEDIEKSKEDGVFFAYAKPKVPCCKPDDVIHLITLSKELCQKILPAKDELCWLAHAKYVDLTDTEDDICRMDGWFSTIIANRFVPSRQGHQVKSVVHLVPIEEYLKNEISQDVESVRFVSLYHWEVYSEETEDASFVSLVNGLGNNTGTVGGETLLPHWLRTGEKTYSIYHGPLTPGCPEQNAVLREEDRYTADGRMIYRPETGLFDISYAAAFNLGRLITLSRRAQAEKIVAWRKKNQVKQHMVRLKQAMGHAEYDLVKIINEMKGEFGG